MKLPAVAMVAAFVCGIALGLYTAVARAGTSRHLLIALFAAEVLALAAGIGLVRFGHLVSGTGASLVSWMLLGALSSAIAQQPLPADHVAVLVDTGQLDVRSPLRWYGTLEDEPSRLPWGYGYDIELSGVDYHEARAPLHGGMRVSFTPHPGDQPPDLHAGDAIAILTRAKRPQIFKDEGAFDRRAYLASQNIDLTATLRSGALLERTAIRHATPGTAVANARRRLREEIEALFGAMPQVAGVLRAMLLGDRSFVDREEATDFQKTGSFMSWSSRDCMWVRWRRYYSGSRAGCGYRPHGPYSSY